MNLLEDPESLVREAAEVDLNEFLNLVDTVVNLQAKESGQVRSLQITGRLVRLKPKGEAIVIGDLHGDLESLFHVLKATGFIEGAKNGENRLLIFLGDYGDRGIHSPEVYYIVLKLKRAFPENVILMRGNHEGPDDLLAHPHDLPSHLYMKFGENSSKAYTGLRKLFDNLHNAVVVEKRYVLLHGGVPTQARTVDDLAFAHKKHPCETHLEEILWSDPWEGLTGAYASPRGAGKLFGENETESFLEMLNVNILIRGHEPCANGFKINHNGRVLTLFSRKGSPYFNEKGAYLQLNLDKIVKKAFELEQFIGFL
jgi:protein phosphatase